MSGKPNKSSNFDPDRWIKKWEFGPFEHWSDVLSSSDLSRPCSSKWPKHQCSPKLTFIKSTELYALEDTQRERYTQICLARYENKKEKKTIFFWYLQISSFNLSNICIVFTIVNHNETQEISNLMKWILHYIWYDILAGSLFNTRALFNFRIFYPPTQILFVSRIFYI